MKKQLNIMKNHFKNCSETNDNIMNNIENVLNDKKYKYIRIKNEIYVDGCSVDKGKLFKEINIDSSILNTLLLVNNIPNKNLTLIRLKYD